jgi:hypothetical protein
MVSEKANRDKSAIYLSLCWYSLLVNRLTHPVKLDTKSITVHQISTFVDYVGSILEPKESYPDLSRKRWNTGFEVLKAVVMKSSVFWYITPCSPLPRKIVLRKKLEYYLKLDH